MALTPLPTTASILPLLSLVLIPRNELEMTGVKVNVNQDSDWTIYRINIQRKIESLANICNESASY